MPTRPNPTRPPARLSGEDLAFLAWESPSRPMHVVLRADFRCAPGETAPSLASVREEVRRRIEGEPRLHCRLERRPWPLRPRWTPVDELRIEDHVRAEPYVVRGGGARRRRLDALIRRPLALERPPWELVMLPIPWRDGRFSLFVKVHHALLDGAGGMALLERLLGDAPEATRAPRPRPRRRGGRSGALRGALSLVRDQLRGAPRTPLLGAPGTRGHHDCASDAEVLSDMALARGATRNDVVLSVVSGTLRRWLEQETLGAPPPGLRAFCPVSVREPRDGELGNRITPWYVPLHVEEPDPEKRLGRIHAATAELRRSAVHRGGRVVAASVERLGGWVARLGMALAARRGAYTVVVSNVPGPRRPLSFLGARATALTPLLPLFPGQRVALAVLEYQGLLHWGLTEALDGRRGGRRLAAALEQELDALAERAAALPSQRRTA